MWYENNDNDIVISTRIRLARNLKNKPFPNSMNSDDKAKVTEDIKKALLESNSVLSKELTFVDLDKISDVEKQALAEQHLMSLQMLKGNGKSLIVNKDKSISIMIMEEDHIRLQVINSGSAIDETWSVADKVDDIIEESIEYAFDNDFGYLTSCPTNTGTGLRASVMMHLPALEISGNISRVVSSASNLGVAIRGMYGEGTKAYASFYQISNQVTLGMSEIEIIEKLKNIVDQIKELEKQARERLLKNEYDALSDKVYRSYGCLKYARSVSSVESKALLSDVLLGQNMGIIPKDSKISPLTQIIMTEPAMISGEKVISTSERDKERAEFIRQNI